MGISPLSIDEGSRLLLDNTSESIAVVQDGMIKTVNPSLLKLTGYSERELTSKPFIEFIHPDVCPAMNAPAGHEELCEPNRQRPPVFQ